MEAVYIALGVAVVLCVYLIGFIRGVHAYNRAWSEWLAERLKPTIETKVTTEDLYPQKYSE